MQAVVKTPHIEINVKGKIPNEFLDYLQEKYGKKLIISDENNKFNIGGKVAKNAEIIIYECPLNNQIGRRKDS